MSTKSKILHGAAELIFKYGIKNITMDDIARHLSMSKKTIYKFYKEKDEIVHSLMQLSIEDDKCRFNKIHDGTQNVVAEVFDMMKEMREIFSKINPIVFHELSKYYPETWKEFQKFKSGFIQEMVENTLIKGQKDGYIRKDINIKLMAKLRVENIEMTLNGAFFTTDRTNMVDVQLAITEHFLYGVCTLKGHKLINTRTLKKNNMIKKLIASLVLLNGLAFAQQKTSFSLQEAVEYSLKNSPNYSNAELDQKSAEYRKKEITGLGLPQVSGSIDFKDYLEIPTSLFPLSAFNPMAPADAYMAVKFGLQYSATAGFSASQLLFSTDYIFGLKVSKEFLNLSRINVQRTKTELVAQVSKAYYGVLVGKERLKLLDLNITRLDKTLTDLKAYNKQGFVEQIDVERLEVANNNLVTEKEKVAQLIKTGEYLLKFQMGYKIYDEISLTDSLNLTDDLKQEIGIANIDISKRSDYQLLESQKNLSETDVKRLKWGYLPTLAAYASYQFNTQRSTTNIFENDKTNAMKQWYPIALVGITLNLNIFDGMQRHYKIQQAKITLEKNNNTLRSLEMASQMESTIAAITFNNSLKTLESNKRNMALAKHIYEVAQKKYDQGIGNNLEIINAQTSVRESEVNYYNAVYDALISKIDYLKATGNLVK